MSTLALFAFQVVVQVPIANADLAKARETAMQEAFVALLRQAVAASPAPESSFQSQSDPSQSGASAQAPVTIPATVASAARTYIERYRVLDEREQQGTLRVVVEGDVATGRLIRALGVTPVVKPLAPLVFEDVTAAAVRGTGLVGAQVRARSMTATGTGTAAGDMQFEAWGFAADPASARIAARQQAETQAALRRPATGLALVISDVDTPVKLEHLRAALANRVPGVQRATLTRVSPGRFEFWLTTARSAMDIASVLIALDFDGFAVEMRSKSPLRMAMVAR